MGRYVKTYKSTIRTVIVDAIASPLKWSWNVESWSWSGRLRVKCDVGACKEDCASEKEDDVSDSLSTRLRHRHYVDVHEGRKYVANHTAHGGTCHC